MPTVKTSAKGQVVIPAEIREEIGLEPGDRVLVRLIDGKVVIEPVAEDPIGAAHGMLRGKPSLTDALRREHGEEEAREAERARLVRGPGLPGWRGRIRERGDIP